MPPARPAIIAHRGASAFATDNTLEAFELAVEQDADMIEFDVRVTADGALVAFHDRAVGGRAVASLTHPDVAAAAGYAVPTLDEVLALARGRIGLDVELKELAATEAAIAAVRRQFTADEVVVTSFLDEAVATVRSIWPDVPAGLLLHEDGVSSAAGALGRATACGASAVALEEALAARVGTAWARAAGLDVFVWTVNQPAALRRLLADPAVAGVITDVPGLACEARDEVRAP